MAEAGRAAQIYVFAHHPQVDDDADHRDPAQWQFYVVPASALPDSQRISLSSLARLAEPVQFERLAEAVGAVADDVGLAA